MPNTVRGTRLSLCNPCSVFRNGAAVLSVALGVRDLANIRFAVSPLWEAVASVRVVKHP